MSSSFDTERLKTNPGDYHQVIALSVKMINDSLRNMFNKAPKESLLREFKYTNKSNSEGIFMKLGPPRISIAPFNSRNQHLFYHVDVTTGDVQVNVMDDQGRNEQVGFSLAGVHLAFPVSIASEILQKGSDDHTKWATSTGFTDEAFTIRRLFVQLTRINDTYDRGESKNIPPELEANEDTALPFEKFILDFVHKMNHRKENFFGVHIQPKHAQVQPARNNMAPTSMEYVHYPWQGRGSSADGIDQKHCLCILSMTGFDEPPPTTQLKYSGPFTEGGAALCLNRKLFWDKWLLPAAKELLKAVHVVPLPPSLDPPDDAQTCCLSGPKFSVGSTLPVSSYTWTVSESGQSWVWEAPLKKESVKKTFSNGTFEADDEASSRVEVSFSGSKITFNGDLTKTYRLLRFDGGTNSESTIESKWTAEFDLFACNSGSVAVTRAKSNVQLEPLRSTHNDWWQTSGGKRVLQDFSIWQGDLQTAFGAAVTNTLNSLTNSMQRKLEDQHKMYLPSGGAFTARNPTFNSRGDLLMDLQYNDFEPPEGPDKKELDDVFGVTSVEQENQASTNSFGISSLGNANDKYVVTHNACGDVIPLAWRAVHPDQQYLPERDALFADHELHHEAGQVVGAHIAVAA